jgi:predicted ATPase/class 3 adenylate cyclase
MGYKMSEVRALLLTDIVDSTKLSESLGDEATAGLWAAHDRVARDLLPRYVGREIDKTDGMLLLFEAATDAVGYAMEYHQALAALPVPLKARAGLHVGPVILRENTERDITRGAKPLEVDGLAKPTAARVMAIAQGGQTLLTSTARQALGDTNWRVQSHGHWIMKGISEPVELFEIGGADVTFTAPADSEKGYLVVRMTDRWLPVTKIPNNLPQQVTSFLGRERELADVRALLRRTRLLTLLGMGGLGKTRLSLRAAEEIMYDYPDGVWFIDLAPIRDPALVVSEAARVLDVQEEPGRPLIQTLCTHLKALRTLLILDNCEHLVKASADLASAILRAAPHVRILASSRETLRVPGEQAYPILPLPVPKRGDGIEALSRSAAVLLFVERAQLNKPGFSLTEREAPAVAELVARLEGIPLALELAAARVRSLPVAEINARLKDRYKILTGGGRALQERQQTLRALVDWSYELLNSAEQTVLCRLGVFAGGFELAAAEQVCGAAPLAPEDVLDILGSLVEKSLVMLDERQEGARYRMLDTISEYAREMAQQTGDVATTRVRHCEHYFAMAKQANRGSKGPQQADWIQRIETDLDNLRGAMALALSGAVDPFIAVKFAVAMLGIWILRGYSTEGRAMVRAALSMPAIQASDLAQAHALYVGAALAESQSDYAEAQQMLETCLTLRRRLGNPVDIAATLSTLSLARLPIGDASGAREGELEALQIFRQLGDRFGEAIGMLHLGQIEMYVGDDTRARSHLEECLAIAREIRNQEVEGECERVLGEIAFEAGDPALARQWFTRSLTVCREAGDKRGDANAQWWLGRVDFQAANFESARARLETALQAFRAFKMQEEILGCLEDHAALASAEGSEDVAVRLSAAAATSRKRLGLAPPPRAERRRQAQLNALRQAMTSADFDAAWNEGREWEVDGAIRVALSARGEPVSVD